MLKPLDRYRRDSTLFQFTTRRLRDFVSPDHPLIRIEGQFDFAGLVAPLEERCCPDNGRSAIHPEVMVRALLLCWRYNISSFRRLSSAIAENPAYRWFCFLTIHDVVFDHSSISCFIERVGREAIFHGLNDELFRLGLLSPEMYADSSLVKANVNSHQLSRSGLAVEEFREWAIEEKGLFVLNDSGVDENGMEWEETKYCQDSPRVVCRSARWTPMPAGAPTAPANRRNSIARTTPSWFSRHRPPGAGGGFGSRAPTHATGTGARPQSQNARNGAPTTRSSSTPGGLPPGPAGGVY